MTAEPSHLGARLLQARRRTGLSTRALAQQLGVSFATVSAVERGREPRWSTLMRYLEVVPGLRAQHLLPSATPHAPAASASMFAYLQRMHGVSATDVSCRLRLMPRSRHARELRVERLASTFELPWPDWVAADLLKLACIAPSEFIRKLPFGPATLRRQRMKEESRTHDMRALSLGPLPSVAYKCSEKDEGWPSELSHEATYPIERLRLVVEAPRGTMLLRPRMLVHPHARPPEEEEADDLLADFHPRGLEAITEQDGRCLIVDVEQVLPGLVYRLRWDAERAGTKGSRGAVPVRRREPSVRPRAMAPLARRVRERLGLSQRELARLLHVSHVTVLEAERGRDVRLSTLRRYVDSIPDVAPQHLLPARERIVSLTPEEAWEYYRDLYLVEAEEIVQHMRYDLEGNTEGNIEVRGLCDLAHRERTVKVLCNLGRRLGCAFPTVVGAMETDVDEAQDALRAKTLEYRDGQSILQVSIPRGHARRGLSFAYHRRQQQVSRMTTVRAQQVMPSHGGRFNSGSSLATVVPARRLRLEVAFPEGYWPVDASAVAWPDARPPTSFGGELFLDQLHGGGHRFETVPEAGRMSLTIDMPLYGFGYGMRWFLP